MMVKIIGGILVVGATSFIAQCILGGYKKRRKSLQSLLLFLDLLRTQMSYSGSVLSEAIEQILPSVERPVYSFLEEVLEHLPESAPVAWSRAVDTYAPLLALTEGDITDLKAFGAGLGNSDLKNQLKAIEALSLKLDHSLREVSALEEKNGKLIRTLGAVSGVLIVILLF